MSNAVFILVNPQMGENIGAAARAMVNFSQLSLRLVNPRDGWPNDAATAMSSGAFDQMNEVEIFDTLEEALADIHTAYATTARPRDMVKDVVTPREAAEESVKSQNQRTAFVFGAERTGLENNDAERCHKIITAPTNPDFSSLNLGQGVLMVAYERFIAEQSKSTINTNIDHEPAPMAEFDNLFSRLESGLEEGGFFREISLRPKVTRNIRSMLLRSGITSQEIKTFHGMIKALKSSK